MNCSILVFKIAAAVKRQRTMEKNMNIKSDVAPFSMSPEADLPPHILEGLNRLGSSQFLRELHQFSNIRCAASFSIKHHNESMRAGWRETELYGLHPAAPGPRVQYRALHSLLSLETR
jgi:hypothetical protein